MMKNSLQIVFALLLLCWARWYADINLQPELYGMAIGMGVGLLIDFIAFLYSERKFLRIYFNCLLLFRKKELRLSISYLYKLECHGKYLLVKSNRINNTYQPVGGVYKYFDPEATHRLNALTIVTDNAIPNDDVSEYDLRLKMRERSNLRQFIKWFLKGTGREWDPWREFQEELVATGILSNTNFSYIHYEHVGQHFEPIHFDQHFRIDTFKYADIYTPKFVNENQKNEIKQLRNSNGAEYLWATETEIRNGVTINGERIAEHSYKIFEINKLTQ